MLNGIVEVKELDALISVFEEFSDSQFLSFNQTPDSRREFAEKQLEYGHSIVEYREGKPVGFACFYCNDKLTKRVYITSFALSENLGLSKGITLDNLFKKGVEISADEGMEFVRIEVDKNNDRAISLYKHMGFQFTNEENKNSYYMEITMECIEKSLGKN